MNYKIIMKLQKEKTMINKLKYKINKKILKKTTKNCKIIVTKFINYRINYKFKSNKKMKTLKKLKISYIKI